MAQSIVHNFRRMSMADLKPREPGYIVYKEGWYEWDGKGKHEEEAFAGHTLGCTRLMVTDNNVEPFHYQDWEPIEHFAAQGVIKDAIWTARLGCLGQIWVDLHQTMVLDREGSYTRPVLGLVRVCAKTKLSRRGEPVQSK